MRKKFVDMKEMQKYLQFLFLKKVLNHWVRDGGASGKELTLCQSAPVRIQEYLKRTKFRLSLHSHVFLQ